MSDALIPGYYWATDSDKPEDNRVIIKVDFDSDGDPYAVVVEDGLFSSERVSMGWVSDLVRIYEG